MNDDDDLVAHVSNARLLTTSVLTAWCQGLTDEVRIIVDEFTRTDVQDVVTFMAGMLTGALEELAEQRGTTLPALLQLLGRGPL